jgi:hypothetical protein
MNNHTQGPWTVDGAVATENLDVFGEGGRVAMLDFDDIDADTLEANARLIAAAPELLAALQDIVDAYQNHFYLFDAMPVAWQTYDNIARAAITKATGEQS